MSDSSSEATERLLQTLEMWEFGVEMTRSRFQREHPTESASQIEARLDVWLRTRPGAELGDGTGRPVRLATP